MTGQRPRKRTRPETFPAHVVRTLIKGPNQIGHRKWEPVDEPLLREAWEALRGTIWDAFLDADPAAVLPYVSDGTLELQLKWGFWSHRWTAPWGAQFDGAVWDRVDGVGGPWQPPDPDAWRR